MNGRLKGVLVALGTAAVGSAVTAGGVHASAAFFDAGPRAHADSTPTPRTVSTATKPITRGDLVDRESIDGTLTYAGNRTIKAGSGGTITSLPAEGKVIKRGGALYHIDRHPRILLYGKLPAYRTLKEGVKRGPDVEQLERNLRALGYKKDMTVDTRFTDATRRAVREWQKDRGMERDGKVSPSDIVFLPEEVRVSETSVEVGDQIAPQRPVLDVTETDRLVRINLDADKQDIAKVGKKVTVKLAGGQKAAGKISRIAKVAKTVKRSDNQESGATVEVEIKVSAKSLGSLDEAPVTVELERRRAENVLTVPVEALLALPEGGYGVEVVEPGKPPARIPVKTGAFGNGRVEVSGAGLAEGMQVSVSGR
ncbi:efflux RND transporter periplasmic adaptor subunit [Nonomuraea sp. 3N208]|uniref:efflux RND transporter periplasmic adaptor subunit n=1 Tax=Nonomuraea sp. 3N208 TaxID=3457421 RepID=UPI003FD48A6A